MKKIFAQKYILKNILKNQNFPSKSAPFINSSHYFLFCINPGGHPAVN